MQKLRQKQINKIADAIEGFGSRLKQLRDEGLQDKTLELRTRLVTGASLDDILPESYAVFREATRRVLGTPQNRVQLIGGIVLNAPAIAEIRGGEEKGLAIALAAYLNALPGTGVHIATLNDQLARRQAELVTPILNRLGLTVGCISRSSENSDKRAAYAADLTYGPFVQFGFDYLHDNLCFDVGDRLQRGRGYIIVDEADSILIDGDLTPLVITGSNSAASAEVILRIDGIARNLRQAQTPDSKGDFSANARNKTVDLTAQGYAAAEKELVAAGLLQQGDTLQSASEILTLRLIRTALNAQANYAAGVDYVVDDDRVVLIDKSTGYQSPGRRFSEGLHPALEAKEGVSIQEEKQTIASITQASYFQLYEKRAGVDDVCMPDADEYQALYDLDVCEVPPNKPEQRMDLPDLFYLTTQEKFQSIIEDIKDCVARGQPVLVGTSSDEWTAVVCKLLNDSNIEHNRLYTSQYQTEIGILARAGEPGAVTVLTSRADRGIDIVLGGELKRLSYGTLEDPYSKEMSQDVVLRRNREQVKLAGGLHVIGTERHERRSQDQQLRQRAGLRGEPGSSRFYLSMEDSLIQIFASDRLAKLMQNLGMEEGEAIEHPWVSRAIENAQQKVKTHNFNIKQRSKQYDKVVSEQREAFYRHRNSWVNADQIGESVLKLRRNVLQTLVREYVPEKSREKHWQIEGLETRLLNDFGVEVDIQGWKNANSSLKNGDILNRLIQRFERDYSDKADLLGEELAAKLPREIALLVLDRLWAEHLVALNFLRQDLWLREDSRQNSKAGKLRSFGTDLLSHSVKILTMGKGIESQTPKQLVQLYRQETATLFNALFTTASYELIQALTRVRNNEEETAEDEDPETSAVPASDDAPETSSQDADHSAAGSEEQETPDRTAEASVFEESPYKLVDGKKIGRNVPCWCGSGKRFKQCHGKLT